MSANTDPWAVLQMMQRGAGAPRTEQAEAAAFRAGMDFAANMIEDEARRWQSRERRIAAESLLRLIRENTWRGEAAAGTHPDTERQ